MLQPRSTRVLWSLRGIQARGCVLFRRACCKRLGEQSSAFELVATLDCSLINADHLRNGLVFYTPLGHWQDVWSDPRFQKHLVNGIRWALGELK
jgi:hypothetical protein